MYSVQLQWQLLIIPRIVNPTVHNFTPLPSPPFPFPFPLLLESIVDDCPIARLAFPSPSPSLPFNHRLFTHGSSQHTTHLTYTMSPSPSPSPSTSHSPSHPPSPSPWPSPSHSSQPSTAQPPIHTYHCLCSTLLLATPYLLSTLPARAPPAKDQARILPLPRFRNNTTTDQDDELEPANADADKDVDAAAGTETKKRKDAHTRGYLPSLLLPALRPARKLTLVQREDGYERRRVWRCGRCGLAIGYEVENAESGKGRDGEDEEETVRVMFVLEEGLVLTERMLGGAGKGGGGKAAATAVEGGGKARS